MKPYYDFSFIIPARDEGLALQETLSHIERTVPAGTFEIILVDDCSQTPFINDISTSAALIYRRCETRQGVARARNIGAALASGNVLFFIDAHVCFSENAVFRLLESGVSDNLGIRGFATHIVHDLHRFVELARGRFVEGEDGAKAYYGWGLGLDPFPEVKINQTRKQDTPFSVPYVGACALAVSKSLFCELGGFDDGLVGFGSLEDAELAMRCWIFGKDVKVIPMAICHHYSQPERKQTRELRSVKPSLDHPRYDGSFTNALRVMYLHFPDPLFTQVFSQLERRSFELGCRAADLEFPSAEIRDRRAWLERRRVRSREWLIDRFTSI